MSSKVLTNLSLTKQQGYYWCWAACLEMVFNYYNAEKKITQSEIVAKLSGKSVKEVLDESLEKASIVFDLPQDINVLKKFIKKELELTIKRHKRNKKSFWELTKKEINNGHPLIANTGAHYVVIIGFTEDATGRYFMVYNPNSYRNSYDLVAWEECDKIAVEYVMTMQSQNVQNLINSAIEINHINEKQTNFPTNSQINGSVKIPIKGVKLNAERDEIRRDIIGSAPKRYDEVIESDNINAYVICQAKWKKVKTNAYNEIETLFDTVIINNIEVQLDNSQYNHLNQVMINTAIRADKIIAQFEKVIFQPFDFRFYHFKVNAISGNRFDDYLIPIYDYTFNSQSLEKGKYYRIDDVMNLLKKTHDNLSKNRF